MNKELKDMSFQELVQQAHIDLMDALLMKGSAEMRSRLFVFMSTAIQWNIEQDKNRANKEF